jgi:hypothetical protein
VSTKLDLTYAVEPLAKLLYHTGVVGQVNAENSGLRTLSPARPQPTEEETARYFSEQFSVEGQDQYRELAKTALDGVRAELDTATELGAQRRALVLMAGSYSVLEAELGKMAASAGRFFGGRRKGLLKARDRVRELRLILERPAPTVDDVETHRGVALSMIGSAE